MNNLWQDIRYGARMLIKNPGFSIIAVIALALGIGANTAIFSVVNSVLLRPLNYKDSDRLVQLNHNYPKLDLKASVSAIGYTHYRDHNKLFENIGAASFWPVNLTGTGDPERLIGLAVTHTFFPTLGVEAALGRVFSPDEDQPGRNRVVVLSQGLWQRRFGADPQMAGKTISLSGENYTVIGVMPPGFQYGREFGQIIEIFSPIALIGGVLGLFIAYWGVKLLLSLNENLIPRAHEIGIDWRVLGFTLGVSLLTGILFGLVPAIQASKTDLHDSLNLLVMQVSLPATKYREPAQIDGFFYRILQEIAALPGVKSAGISSTLPLSGSNSSGSFNIEGRTVQPGQMAPWGNRWAAGASYFQTMNIPLIRGRYFDDRDVAGAPGVAIIDETMARKFWPNEDPLGKRITFQSDQQGNTLWREIVGIVGHVKHTSLDGASPVQYYFPHRQLPSRNAFLVTRTASKPENQTSAVRGVIQSVWCDVIYGCPAYA